MVRLVESPRACRQRESIAAYIGKDRPSAARRFLAAVAKAYKGLAAMPEMGAPWETEDPFFQGIRYFCIPRYNKFIIFYRVFEDTIEILHVLHGSRDLELIIKRDIHE